MAERSEPSPPVWEPPSTFEERLANTLIPAPFYWRLRAWRERRRGEREIALLPILVDGRRVSIDVGANKGVYTYWLARYSRHVYAFEPNPKIFRILKASAARAPRVTLSPIALSDASGRAQLHVPRTESGYSNQRATLHEQSPGCAYGELEVETRRLDDEGIDEVGFIKIDVEGHEFAVLDGAAETIRRDRPVTRHDRDRGRRDHPAQPDSTRSRDRSGPGQRPRLCGVCPDPRHPDGDRGVFA